MSKMRTSRSNHARQSGVSIVEALVALVILSVGMLGIAGMYLQSLQSNRSATSRTAAVQLVNDLADRIRANRMGRTDYAVTKGTEPANKDGKDCATVNCTPPELAAYDLGQWFTAVKATLPKTVDPATLEVKNPVVSVTFTPGTSAQDPDRYVVMAAWREPGDTTLLSAQVEVLQLRGPNT